jgi:uncharacterized protein YPO0396
MYRDFRELDWRSLTVHIDRLTAERKALEAASDVLRTLQGQLDAVENELDALEARLSEAQRKLATTESKHADAIQLLTDANTLLDATPKEGKALYFPKLDAMREDALGDRSLTVESCDNRQSEMRDWLQARINTDTKRSERLRDSIINAMGKYKSAWPVETSDVDVNIDAAPEYRKMLKAMRDDDLPRFELRFKQLLNENTIREVANFQAQINKEREEIGERIGLINKSLRAIDYNPNRYISLLAEQAWDAEVSEFRAQLRACTEGALTGSDDEQYSEAKFLQVKAIIERFRGR